MLGLVLVVAMALYLALLLWATRRGWRWGVEKGWTGRKRWLGAAIGFLIVYLPVFWDWLPTVALHQYYCAKESGFWVYKTLEQWKQENPGVMETLVANKGAPSTRDGDDTNFIDTYFLNHRINKVVQEHRVVSVFHVFRHEQELIDSKTNRVLARYVNFRAGYPNGVAGIAPRSAGIASLKFWLVNERCADSSEHPQHKFYEFESQFTGGQK